VKRSEMDLNTPELSEMGFARVVFELCMRVCARLRVYSLERDGAKSRASLVLLLTEVVWILPRKNPRVAPGASDLHWRDRKSVV
jgi:hypothetical protein